jgi:lysophospholipase L1-like esterase
MASLSHHYLQLAVSGSTDPAFSSVVANRWAASSPNTATILTGIVLAAGSEIGTPVRKSGNIALFGDSITEGLRTLYPNISLVDVDSNASEYGWAFLIGDLLDCEVGVVGFGGQGLGVGGDGAVPAFPATFNYLFSGVSRSFSPTPNLVVINHGTNDAVHSVAAASTIAGLGAALDGILAMTTAPIAVLQPFGSTYATQETTNIESAISACSNPSRVNFINTQSPNQWMLAADMADAWHPNAIANLSRIAPLCAGALRSLVWPGSVGATGPVVVLVS